MQDDKKKFEEGTELEAGDSYSTNDTGCSVELTRKGGIFKCQKERLEQKLKDNEAITAKLVEALEFYGNGGV